MEKKKLEVRDMITIGIFATMIIVVKTIVGFIGMIPIFNAILPAITAIVCAPIYALFVSKVNKFGMITLLTSFIGLVGFVVGYGVPTFVGSIILGIIADVITMKDGHKTKKNIFLGYCVQAQWGVTMYIQIWLMGDAYFEELSLSMGNEFATKFQQYVPWYSVFWLVGLTAICAVIGMFIANKIMKKHFDRLGETE